MVGRLATEKAWDRFSGAVTCTCTLMDDKIAAIIWCRRRLIIANEEQPQKGPEFVRWGDTSLSANPLDLYSGTNPIWSGPSMVLWS